MITETITVTKIQGDSVSYSGSEYFNGCHITNFPHAPKVDEKFLLKSDFVHPSTIEEFPTNS